MDRVRIARWAGWSLLATIVVGILATVSVADGIDINLSADVEATARAMLAAEERLRGKAYVGLLIFGLEAFFALALYLVLRAEGVLLAAWSLVLSLTGACLTLAGAVFAMNAAELGGNAAYRVLADDPQRLLLTGLQATSDYTSFHLSLVLTSVAKAGFFYLFLRGRLMPWPIPAWGLFASLFVAVTIVARDFIPLLGNSGLTITFMLSNLIALISTGGYLSLKGVRRPAATGQESAR